MENKKTIKYHRICFVAGKSGGHILPCITLAQQVMHKHPHYEVMFFSTASDLDKQLINGNAIIKHYIPLNLETHYLKKIITWPLFAWQLMYSFIKSVWYLRKLNPEAVISTGGYIAIPVCLAARLLRIPIELYELNAVPGKAVKFLAPLAYKVWICFEKSTAYLPAKKCALTHYPIKFNDSSNLLTKQETITALNFSPERKTILILGGSQGSLFINAAIKHMLERWPDARNTIQIIHQTGALDRTDWASYYEQLTIPHMVFSYSDALGNYYVAADLVICRAGAGTLAEVSFFNKKCITIPLETASTNHQIDNAAAAAQMRPDLFTILNQNDITHNNKLLFQSVSACLQTN
jgi:UDP-N-acetylglucosamine--N-acetylmuramyl-(pentapeptide) pyrophosphoryl-undecaprenol N-acetylglucosamine transferase